MKADLHNHLRTSSNLKDHDFNKAVDTTLKRLGKNSLIGMVNFEDARYESLTGQLGYDREDLGSAVYIPEKKVTIVKGQEIPTKQGHLLVFGLQHGTYLASGRDIKDTIKEAKDNNGIIVLDHLFYFEGVGDHLMNDKSILRDVDAIEVYNGTCSFGIPKTPLNPDANQKALDFFNEYGSVFKLGGLVSSDGHSFYELCRSYSELEDISIEDFNDSLRASIRNHKSFENDRKGSLIGKIGAIDHIVDLIWISKIAPKIGLGKLYEVEMPDNK